jgi:hypothetical protein
MGFNSAFEGLKTSQLVNVKNAKQNITSQHSDILEYYAIWVKCHVLEGSRHIIHPVRKSNLRTQVYKECLTMCLEL